MEINKVYHGKMEIVLKDFPDNSIDSVVTDPPYGLSFMGKHWDYDVPTVEQWEEAFRVLKPGGFLLAFGGTRTYHRMVVNIEDAGFEIRDQIQWLYGSGFPKSLDIGKAIDNSAGAEREVLGANPNSRKTSGNINICKKDGTNTITAPATEAAKEWNGWGTALKPANEPICVARKPLEGTVANNVLKWGTGGLNIDGCRIETGNENIPEVIDYTTKGIPHAENDGGRDWINERIKNGEPVKHYIPNTQGRFPANVILDEFMGEVLDRQSGNRPSGGNVKGTEPSDTNGNIFKGGYTRQPNIQREDEGGASRFFYCPKPDNFERNKGLKGLNGKKVNDGRQTEIDNPFQRGETIRQNHHPTVKPIDLMRYLVRLVTKKGGIVLDPFCGSGTTLIAAKLELMNYVGIDMDETHIPLAEARVKNWNPDLYKPQELF